MAGNLLEEELTLKGEIANLDERQVIVRSLLATTLPKLFYADCDRFVQLVSDIFPGVDITYLLDNEFSSAVKAVLKGMNLQV